MGHARSECFSEMRFFTCPHARMASLQQARARQTLWQADYEHMEESPRDVEQSAAKPSTSERLQFAAGPQLALPLNRQAPHYHHTDSSRRASGAHARLRRRHYITGKLPRPCRVPQIASGCWRAFSIGWIHCSALGRTETEKAMPGLNNGDISHGDIMKDSLACRE